MRRGGNSELPQAHIPAEAELGEVVPPLLSSHIVNIAPEKYYFLPGLLHLVLFIGGLVV